ncbi:hypothetical protein G6F16_006911 [Rhizopus arrhizus]|nr:hypothetical protein G6F24_005259 [Rhizopus arrhizus]KAG0796793.1 hypothetical protein G6F21_001040 [Rhizopus arrhizus]KAG0818043.1 hypothetical protein G6F20_001898 [Rhizopus arrhizus]KAG0831884.1 hypothetical protein G6F19_006514 [Rhizopus arrhizus]KAG0833814.1 hypothetical protein G6F18_006608 [Rhizopus arrhizus]
MPTVKQLQAELAAAKAEITRLKQQNASLLERLAHASNAIASKKPVSTLVSSPTGISSTYKRPPPSDLGSSPPQKAAKLKASTPLPSQMAAAGTFSVRSTNHGYKFLYLPIRRRLPIGQIRSRLRQLNINTRRILNIHYSDRDLIALLIHNDYETGLHSLLKKFEIPVQDGYDPLDPSNLRDPKYDDCGEADRTCAARGLFLCRILRALDHLRGPIKRAVANFFANKGYMDPGDFPELFPVKNT